MFDWTPITNRYIQLMGYPEPVQEDNPGTGWNHLSWMLDQIPSLEFGKACRWLGFVQGILIGQGLTTVEAERDFTRPFFKPETTVETDPRKLIKAAAKYRSGSDSCNSVYMGSMATASLMRILGGSYGEDSLNDLLEKADAGRITSALEFCDPYIRRMLANPRRECLACGVLVNEEGKAV